MNAPAEPQKHSFRALVKTSAQGGYDGNGLRFPTEDEASRYATDLASRWLLVIDHKVERVEDEPPNYTMDDDGEIHRIEGATV